MKNRKMSPGFMMGAIACGLRAHKPRPKPTRKLGVGILVALLALIG